MLNGKKRLKLKLDNLSVTDYLVFICILSIDAFVIVSMYFYYKHGIDIPDIKTEVFAFFGVELLAMATIAVSKNVRKGVISHEEEDDVEC